MKIKILFFIIIFFLSGQVSNAEMVDDEFFNLMSQLFDLNKTTTEDKKEDNIEIKLSDKQKDIIENVSDKKLLEFQEHFYKYYPRVFVIREKFLVNMTPDNIAKVFDKIINIIAYKPWVYIEGLFNVITKKLTTEELKTWEKNEFNIQLISKKLNNPSLEKALLENNGFEEFIADQLSFFHEFLNYSKVNLNSKITFFNKTNKYSSYSPMSIEKKDSTETDEALTSYWRKNGIKTSQNFYELCFSYFSRLFIRSINQENLQLTNKYYYDLKKIFSFLKNSPQESKTREFLNKYKDLLSMLKQRIYSTKFSFLKDDKEFSELLDYWDSKDS